MQLRIINIIAASIILTHNSRVTKFVFVRGSAPRTLLGGGAHGSPQTPWWWRHPSPLSTRRCLRCLVLGTSPFNPSTEVFPLFLFYEMPTTSKTSTAPPGKFHRQPFATFRVRLLAYAHTETHTARITYSSPHGNAIIVWMSNDKHFSKLPQRFYLRQGGYVFTSFVYMFVC